MTSLATIDAWRYMSLNQLSQIFGIARETVKSRIDIMMIPVADTKNGHALYDAKVVYQAICEYNQARYNVGNPDDLPPKERRDWYEGSNAKTKHEKETGRLVEAEKVRGWMAELIKPGLQLIETIPDVLERDYQVDTIAIIDIEKKLDNLRDNWADQIEQLCT